MRRELRAFQRPQVWLTLLVGALGFGGFFAVYTYVSPVVTTVTGLDVSLVPFVLMAAGVGMTIGNFAGGRAADHHVLGTLFVCFGIFAVALTGLALTAQLPAGLFFFVFLVSGAASALSPAIQTRLMDVAGDSQTLAAAINHSALNVGNSLGAYFGGVTIAAGFGYLSPTWVGLLLCAPGVGLALISALLQRRSTRSAGSERVEGVRLDEDAVLDSTLA